MQGSFWSKARAKGPSGFYSACEKVASLDSQIEKHEEMAQGKDVKETAADEKEELKLLKELKSKESK